MDQSVFYVPLTGKATPSLFSSSTYTLPVKYIQCKFENCFDPNKTAEATYYRSTYFRLVKINILFVPIACAPHPQQTYY